MTLTLTEKQAQTVFNNLQIELTPAQIDNFITQIGKEQIVARIEGQLAKMVSDQIALQLRDSVANLLEKPDFNQKVQEHILKLVGTMQQVTFRKV